jgi:hypothetical protein
MAAPAALVAEAAQIAGRASPSRMARFLVQASWAQAEPAVQALYPWVLPRGPEGPGPVGGAGRAEPVWERAAAVRQEAVGLVMAAMALVEPDLAAPDHQQTQLEPIRNTALQCTMRK